MKRNRCKRKHHHGFTLLSVLIKLIMSLMYPHIKCSRGEHTVYYNMLFIWILFFYCKKNRQNSLGGRCFSLRPVRGGGDVPATFTESRQLQTCFAYNITFKCGVYNAAVDRQERIKRQSSCTFANAQWLHGMQFLSAYERR